MRAPWMMRPIARLDIRSKLAIAFLGLSGVPLTLVGWYAANAHLESLSQSATEQQRRDLAVMRQKVQALLTTVEEDLHLLAESDALTGFLEQPPGANGRLSGDGADPRPVEVAFRDFLRSKRYQRLRLLARGGLELAHVTRAAGGPRIVPGGRWKGTGYRFYETLLEGLPPRVIALAPVELRPPDVAPNAVTSGTSTVVAGAEPAGPIPAFSFAGALERGAILVADVDARLIFEALQPAEERRGEILALVDAEGHYLYHSSLKSDWNTLLATEAEHNLYQDLPDQLAQRVLSGVSGVDAEGPGSVVAFSPLFDTPYPVLGRYTLVSTIPKEVLFAPVSEVRRVIFGSGAVTILIAGILALIAAQQFAAPIRALTRGAAEIARGRFETRLELHTGDEIEDLARSLSSMASALAERERAMFCQEQELRRHSENLEVMVAERTRELEESHEKLVQQEKMTALGRLAAGVAHELGTPLATILCHTEMLAEDMAALARQLPEAQRAGLEGLGPELEVLLGEAARCRDIVRDLLELARPSRREVERLSIAAVIRRTASLMERDLDKQGVALKLDLPDEDLAVEGNEGSLVQVLINLLLNARDAMPEGGSVSVSVRHEPSRTASGRGAGRSASAEQERRGDVVIEVEDTGEGIDAGIRARIFEPFFTTKDPGIGTGLGLWVVYNTIADHGGRIDVTSRAGQGTRFVITLPAVS